MHLLLDVERRRLDDEVAPVLLVLAAPDELRIEVAVAPLVRDAHRRLVRLIDERLVLGGRDVRAGVLEVRERLDRLRDLRAAASPLSRSRSPAGLRRQRVNHVLERAPRPSSRSRPRSAYTSVNSANAQRPYVARVVDRRNPVRLHRRLLLLRVLAPVALDLDDEMQEIVVAVPVVDEDDEVGDVGAALRAVAVRHLEPEVVVLDVRADARVRLDDAAELALPVAVEDDPVDVAAAGVRLPAVRSCDVLKLTCAVEPAGLYGSSTAVTGRSPTYARVIAAVIRSQAMSASVLYFSCAGIRAALADEVVVEPLPRDPLQLAEEVELRIAVGVAPLGQHEVRGELVDHLGRAHVAGVLRA